jgi:8-oxo-dGTP diphosphatase
VENIPTWQLVVAGALRREDGRWLMHKRPLEKHHGGLWEFPGGKVEIGENPSSTLVRELQEELGIEVDPAQLLPASFAHEPADSEDIPIVILLYIIDQWLGSLHPLEGGEIGWFDPLEAVQLAKPPLDSDLVARLFREDSS